MKKASVWWENDKDKIANIKINRPSQFKQGRSEQIEEWENGAKQ